MKDNDSGPTREEMISMLERPPNQVFHPLVNGSYICDECGETKADWWFLYQGVTKCNKCATVQDF